MYKYQPHLRILVVVCRWFSFRFVPRGLLRIRGQESECRHVAMEINAPSSDFLVESMCVGCVSSPESLRYADGTLTRLPRHAYSTPLQ